MSEKIYRMYGYDTVTKTVKKSGNGAGVTVPLAWLGKMVKIILLDDLNQKNNEIKV